MFNELIYIDWTNEDLGLFLATGLGGFIFFCWFALSSFVQAIYFVDDQPLRYWSNPFRKTGKQCDCDEAYKGLFNYGSSLCDSDDKAFDVIVMFFASYLLVWVLLVINYVWLPIFIVAGISSGLFGARAILRLKKALTNHINDKNAHKGDE